MVGGPPRGSTRPGRWDVRCTAAKWALRSSRVEGCCKVGQVGRRGALRGWSAAAVDEESASSSSSSKVEEKEEEDSSKCVDGPSRSGTWAAAARELGRSSYGRATGAEVGPVGGPPLGAAWTGRHGLGGGLPRVRLGAEPCVMGHRGPGAGLLRDAEVGPVGGPPPDVAQIGRRGQGDGPSWNTTQMGRVGCAAEDMEVAANERAAVRGQRR